MLAPIAATVIFVAMFVMVVWEKIERHITTLVAGLLMIVVVFLAIMHSPQAVWETLNLQSIVQPDFWYSSGASESVGINWETIIFITGMMIMVEGMGHAGFFRWLCLRLAKAVKYKTVPLLVTFMLMSAVLAMFIDSITVILFLAAVTVELAKTLEFDPVPMIISEIFCANLGGSATMCGDPPNIIIGTALGYSFADFIGNTGVIAFLCLFLVVAYFTICFGKNLKKSEATRKTSAEEYPQPSSAIESKKDFAISVVIFAIAIVLLVTHAQTHLTVSAIGVFVAILTVITSKPKVTKHIFKHLDYKTLLFFIGLFIVVGGLEQTGVLEKIAAFIEMIGKGNSIAIVCIVIWISAIASAFVDNIPFAATMVPVITRMASPALPLDTLVWSLSLGTDLGGNATPIGASANVMGISVASKYGHKITWGKYCKYSAPATIVVVALCTVYIIVRYL
jgi:Na+/H+ antiporter NhaD/arsenite permease-like protein